MDDNEPRWMKAHVRDSRDRALAWWRTHPDRADRAAWVGLYRSWHRGGWAWWYAAARASQIMS